MTGNTKQQLQQRFLSVFPLFAASVSGGLLVLKIDFPLTGATLLLPISAALLTALWAHFILRRAAGVVGCVTTILLGVALAHLFFWLPFVLASYFSGQGAGRADYSVLAALFTSAAVGWYTFETYFWQSLGVFATFTLIAYVLGAFDKRKPT